MLTKELLKQLESYIEENFFERAQNKNVKSRKKRSAKYDRKYLYVCQRIATPLERLLEKNLSAADEETFAEYLLRYMDERGADPVEVYKDAHLDRRFLSKLRTNRNYKPHKRTLIAIAFGMKLNLREAKSLLKHGGYYLSPHDKADVIAKFFLEQNIHDLFEVNEALDNHGCKPLGC